MDNYVHAESTLCADAMRVPTPSDITPTSTICSTNPDAANTLHVSLPLQEVR